MFFFKASLMITGTGNYRALAALPVLLGCIEPYREVY